MSFDAGGVSDDRAALELHCLLGDGDAALGQARLGAWLALGFLPAVPAYVRTSYALWRPDEGWTRRSGPITPALLLGHFRGEWALGGVFAGQAAVFVHDLDNQAGKHGAADAVDADLAARAALVARAQPSAVWVRSSGTGGMHAWSFLDEAHPLRAMAYLAHDRLLRTAAADPAMAARLSNAPVAGVPGFLELLPQLFDQGGVIRAPLGPGSALLDEQLRPLALSPGEAVARLVELAAARRVGLLEAFPLVRAALPVPQVAPEARGAPPGARSPAPKTTRCPRRRDASRTSRERPSWVTRLRQCDGRLPPEARPPRHVYERVMQHVWEHGLPGASTRHAATFLLALSCRWQGLKRDEAQERVVGWFEGGAGHGSREWKRDPRRAARKTREIVRHTYRAQAPRPARRRRYAPPGDVRLADQARLEKLFPADGLAVEVALRVLRWARTNARVVEGGRVVCEMPLRALGITTRRRRAAWQRVHDCGEVFRLYAARVPKRDEDHPLGPCRARAARYTILWSYADEGPRIRGRARMSSRRVSYLASLQGVGCDSANTVRRPGAEGVLKTHEYPQVRHVGAVHAGAQGAASTGAPAPACKPLWETRSVFHSGGSVHMSQGCCSAVAEGWGVRGEGAGSPRERPAARAAPPRRREERGNARRRQRPPPCAC